MKSNYHTHTYLCQHAVGNVEDYVKEAINQGFKILGMSDHGPLLHAPFPRMSIFDFFNIYLKEINEVKEKYKDQIKIYSAVEIEYVKCDYEYLKQLKSNLDYMVLGPHYSSKYDMGKLDSSYRVSNHEILNRYEDMIVEAINTGLFNIIAHPDIFCTSYPKFDSNAAEASKRIIQAAINNNCILEINANGFRSKRKTGLGYPCKEFFQIAKDMGAKIMIGLDAHDPKEFSDEAVTKVIEFAKELNIEPIEEVEF